MCSWPVDIVYILSLYLNMSSTSLPPGSPVVTQNVTKSAEQPRAQPGSDQADMLAHIDVDLYETLLLFLTAANLNHGKHQISKLVHLQNGKNAAQKYKP